MGYSYITEQYYKNSIYIRDTAAGYSPEEDNILCDNILQQ